MSGPAEWVRHRHFYNLSDSTVFLISPSGVLLRLSIAQWAHRSPFIRSMIQGHIGTPGEGSSDQHPIVLLYGTVDEYEFFLPIIFPRSARDIGAMSAREPRELLAIYKLTGYYDMQDDRQLAYNALTAHPDFDPAYKLLSAHQLKITEWRAPALRALLRIGTDKLTLEQKAWLHAFEVDGQAFYLTLAEFRSWLGRSRLEVAEAFTECQKHVACRGHTTCESMWTSTWNSFLRHWLHSSQPCSEEQARTILNGVNLEGRGPCLHGMRDRLVEKALLVEEEHINALLEKLEFASQNQ